jgi:hypothetical protein
VHADLAPNGLATVDLKSGAAGKARVSVTGKGGRLPLPPLPVTSLPLTVQLTNGVGTCWSARYQNDVRTNDDTAFKAGSD